tara:strand:+ start:61 stop:294 length:234 start_codon:yes stop_codon:yes gene_type:complete
MEFKHSKHSSQGREERIDYILSEIRKEYPKDTNISTLADKITEITQVIRSCLLPMRFSPTTRKDYEEQILLEMKVIQ